MKAKSLKTHYRFEIGNLDVEIVHESETEDNLASVDIPELCLIATQLDELILALMNVRRDMKLRGFETGKPRKGTPSITVMQGVRS